MENKETVIVSNEELVTVREAMRGLHHLIEQLQTGEQEQFILMHRGHMVAKLTRIAK